MAATVGLRAAVGGDDELAGEFEELCVAELCACGD